MLQAAEELVQAGVVHITLLGSPQEVVAKAIAAGVDGLVTDYPGRVTV